MLDYFPKYFSVRAIICYVVTLVLVSIIFFSYALPFQFMLFGFAAVCLFFVFAHQTTYQWRIVPQQMFTKKLFFTALAIRVVYVIFIYFYYIAMTGQPMMFHSGDESFYHYIGTVWPTMGFQEMRKQVNMYVGLSDSGYCWWVGLVYRIFGPHVLSGRLVKCVIDAFSCVLVYNLAKRNFGEATGRMTAIFCMLMPNMWYYCGITLKEIEMAFVTLLFVERADNVVHASKVKVFDMLLPLLCILVSFTFRTALGLVLTLSLAIGLVFTSGRQLSTLKKVLYGAVFALWLFLSVGVEIVQETQQVWEQRTENQSVGYEERAKREGGNVFSKYVSGVVAAPMIFTIPFSSMVYIEDQENQMMLNGANFIKNVTSGLTIFALFVLLFSGDWRKHVLPIATMCGYLVVIAFSNFAHSERFHFPVLALELMFAAYGVTQLQNKHKRWFVLWLVFIGVINIGWAWFKLAGRGLV